MPSSSQSAGLGAHGQVLHTDDQTHPELFWALRGGGGNFGVATRLQFRLHQLDQSKSPKGHDQRNAESRESSWSPTATVAPPGRSWPLAGSSHRQRAIPGEEDIMLLKHAHQPGRFDPGHCRGCAHQADLLDYYWQVQREEQAFKEAHRWARRAHRHASWALWCSGIGILLAVLALLTG